MVKLLSYVHTIDDTDLVALCCAILLPKPEDD